VNQPRRCGRNSDITILFNVNLASFGLAQVGSAVLPTAAPVVLGFVEVLDSSGYIPSKTRPFPVLPIAAQ